MANSAGDAFVDILPSFQRFGAALNKGVDPELKRSATHIGNELAKDLEPEGRKAGRAVGDGMEREVAASGAKVGGAAKKAFSNVGSALSSANLDMNPLTGSLGAVSNAFSQMDDSAGRFSKTAVVAGLGAAGIGAALTKMGEESRQASAQLEQAIVNSGHVMSDFSPKVKQVSNDLIKLGFDDEATARSLATLTTALQDPAKALDLMALAADLAAAKHISLEDASKKLALAQNGNIRVFKEFGIQLSATATEAEKAAAFTELAARVQGQAEVQADSFVGKLTAMRIQFENVAEAVGEKAGPALTLLGPLLAGVGGLAQAHAGGLRGLASSALAVAGPLAAIGAVVGVAAIAFSQMNDKIKLSGEAMRDMSGASTPALVKVFGEMEKLNRFGFDTSATFRTLAETSFGAAQRLVEGLEAAGSKSGFTKEQIAKLRAALDEVATANRQAATDADGNAVATTKVMTAAEAAAGQVANLTTGLGLLIGVHVSASQAAVTYHTNLSRLTEGLAENGTTLDLTTEKGRQNRTNIDSMVTGIQSHITALANEGTSMDGLRTNFNSHIEDLRRTMLQGGYTTEQIDGLLTSYGLVPSNVDTFLAIHGETAYNNALSNARQKAGELNAVVGMTDVSMHPSERGGFNEPIKRAKGGQVPGTGTGDTVPAWLTPGEFVIRKDVVDKIGVDALEQINAQRFSTGGLVQSQFAAGNMPQRPTLEATHVYDLSWATAIYEAVAASLAGKITAEKARQAAAAAAAMAGSSTGLEPNFLGKFNAWNASRGNDLSIVSGFRSRAEQEVLYARYLAGTGNLAAKPGTSMHEKGLAIDHAPSNWGMDVGSRNFGLHHPVGGEPWHVEPFDKGGVIQPGWNMVRNDTGADEALVPGGIDYERLAGTLVKALRQEQPFVVPVQSVMSASHRAQRAYR